MLISRLNTLLSQSLLIYITCLTFNKKKKKTRHREGKKKILRKRKQLSQLNSDLTKMLGLLDKKFKVIMTNVLKALMEIWNNVQIRGLVSVEEIEAIGKR